MSKKNTGKKFESLNAKVAKIFADDNTLIEEDVMVPGVDRERQFDVVVTRRVEPFGDLKVGIEARDWNSKMNVSHLDAFASKIDDCSDINKGIMINRRGFSNTAIKKAKRLGIGLFRLENRSQEILDTAFALPIVVTEHRVLHVETLGKFYCPKNVVISRHEYLFNGLTYNQLCLKAIQEHPTNLEKVTKIEIPIESFSADGISMGSVEFKFEIHVITRNHFGFVNELPGTIVLKDQSGSEDRVIIDSSEILKSLLFRNWPVYLELENAPDHTGVLTCGTIAAHMEPSFARQFFKSSITDREFEELRKKDFRIRIDPSKNYQ